MCGVSIGASFGKYICLNLPTRLIRHSSDKVCLALPTHHKWFGGPHINLSYFLRTQKASLPLKT